MEEKDFFVLKAPEPVCLLCGGGVTKIGKKPRDRETADIVVCKQCGHIQMFPLLSPEEEKEEYDNDQTIRFGKVKIVGGSDFESMRIKFSEWTKEHADIYYDTLQKFNNVLELGAGYGFFMEEIRNRPDCHFAIEGIEIGKFRLDNFVGGIVHNVNIIMDKIPENICHKYDCIICMHTLEHISKPILFLEKVKLLLKRGGYVIFEVPNINCFLSEISPEYKDFMYLYEHCSYFSADTLRFAFEKAGYIIESVKTYEIYSIENHCRWIREGIPFAEYNQMYMPDDRLEWINKIYKNQIGEQGKGFALTIQATIDA